MTEINERISILIQRLNLSQNKFAMSLGTSSSRISNIVTKRNKPDSELVQRILSVYRNVSADWLLLNEGDVFREEVGSTSVKTNETIGNIYSFLSIDQKGVVLDSGNGKTIISGEDEEPFKSIIAALNFLVEKKGWIVVDSHFLDENPSFLLKNSTFFD